MRQLIKNLNKQTNKKQQPESGYLITKKEIYIPKGQFLTNLPKL